MHYVRVGFFLYSMRREVIIIAATLLALILLPGAVAIGVLTNGVQGISDDVAKVDVSSGTVRVKGPGGKLIELDIASAWPIPGVVTQEFGNPNPPYQASHSGIDIDGGYGKPVTAAMEGTVSRVGDVLPGCGPYCVMIDHGNDITSVYAHMASRSVDEGEKVSTGTPVGTQGEEGWAMGDHLHFEVKVGGIPVNPRTFLSGEPE